MTAVPGMTRANAIDEDYAVGEALAHGPSLAERARRRKPVLDFPCHAWEFVGRVPRHLGSRALSALSTWS